MVKYRGLVVLIALAAIHFDLAQACAAVQSGIASIYSTGSGGRTASGERLNPNALTAAHRTLPFGTHVLVTNKKNGRSVEVTINDRGPFVRGRVIDLTPAAARELGFSGLTKVVVSPGGKNIETSRAQTNLQNAKANLQNIEPGGTQTNLMPATGMECEPQSCTIVVRQSRIARTENR
jgi:rare lipoprotein A